MPGPESTPKHCGNTECSAGFRRRDRRKPASLARARRDGRLGGDDGQPPFLPSVRGSFINAAPTRALGGPRPSAARRWAALCRRRPTKGTSARVDPSYASQASRVHRPARVGPGAVRARLFSVLSVPRGERGGRAGSGRRPWPERRRAGAAHLGLSTRVRPVPAAARRPARPLRTAPRPGGAARVCRRGLVAVRHRPGHRSARLRPGTDRPRLRRRADEWLQDGSAVGAGAPPRARQCRDHVVRRARHPGRDDADRARGRGGRLARGVRRPRGDHVRSSEPDLPGRPGAGGERGGRAVDRPDRIFDPHPARPRILAPGAAARDDGGHPTSPPRRCGRARGFATSPGWTASAWPIT
jgi:hypothetical protein